MHEPYLADPHLKIVYKTENATRLLPNIFNSIFEVYKRS